MFCNWGEWWMTNISDGHAWLNPEIAVLPHTLWGMKKIAQISEGSFLGYFLAILSFIDIQFVSW